MPFTLNDVEAIFKEGDFKEFVRRLKRIGVLAYDYNNQIGEFTFYGADGYQAVLPSNGLLLEPVEKADTEAAQRSVKKRLQGALEFSQFSKEMAAAGIFSWETNLEKLSVEYYNKKGEVAYREVFASIFD